MSNKAGDLQIWWIPQVPMKAFEVPVSSLEEGVKIMDVLADYDLFQYENKIKPDYSNTGGLSVWSDASDGEGNSGWQDWYDEDSGEEDPREFLKQAKGFV